MSEAQLTAELIGIISLSCMVLTPILYWVLLPHHAPVP